MKIFFRPQNPFLLLLVVRKMPHTTTKAVRVKRPDSRPNGKRRMKLSKQMDDAQVIQDIRVTKLPVAEKKERVNNNQPIELTKDEKLIRALKKKLKGIDKLMEDQKAGKVLNELQLNKISTLEQTMKDLEALISSNTQEEDELS